MRSAMPSISARTGVLHPVDASTAITGGHAVCSPFSTSRGNGTEDLLIQAALVGPERGDTDESDHRNLASNGRQCPFPIPSQPPQPAPNTNMSDLNSRTGNGMIGCAQFGMSGCRGA